MASSALILLTDRLYEHLGVEQCCGIAAPVDEDAMAFSGEPSDEGLSALSGERIVEDLRTREGVTRDDIALVSDRGSGESASPGIHMLFNARPFHDFLNQHGLGRESLIGALRAFGTPVAR